MADFRITIDLPDLSPDEAHELAEYIEEEKLQTEFDEFTIRVSQKVGDQFFTRDPGDDLIEG